MKLFIEETKTEEAVDWVGWAFNQVWIYLNISIYAIAQPCLERSPMRVHMARWWYYVRSPRTTVGSFPLKIYLSELRRISSVKTKITWFIFEASHFTNEWKEVSPISADIKARYSAQSWRSLSAIWSYFINCPLWHIYFYRTRVRSLFTLVTNSLTHSLTHWPTHWLLFSKP